jgi:hypothetical protein
VAAERGRGGEAGDAGADHDGVGRRRGLGSGGRGHGASVGPGTPRPHRQDALGPP